MRELNGIQNGKFFPQEQNRSGLHGPINLGHPGSITNSEFRNILFLSQVVQSEGEEVRCS